MRKNGIYLTGNRQLFLHVVDHKLQLLKITAAACMGRIVFLHGTVLKGRNHFGTTDVGIVSQHRIFKLVADNRLDIIDCTVGCQILEFHAALCLTGKEAAVEGIDGIDAIQRRLDGFRHCRAGN